MKDLPEYTNVDVLERIVVRVHNVRDRKMLVDKLIHGLTYEQVAEAHDMSVSQTKRIVKRGIHTIFK